MIDRQTETGTRLLNRLLRADHAIDRHFQCGLISVKLLLADGALPNELFAPLVVLLREQ